MGDGICRVRPGLPVLSLGSQIPYLPSHKMQAEQPKMAPTLENERAGGKLWRVGTLTYTGGALAVLFCWLLWGDFAWSMKERAIGPIIAAAAG